MTLLPRLNSRGYILGVLGDSQPSNQENIKLSQTGARFGQSSRGGGGDPRLGLGSQQVRIAMNRFVVTVGVSVSSAEFVGLIACGCRIRRWTTRGSSRGAFRSVCYQSRH